MLVVLNAIWISVFKYRFVVFLVCGSKYVKEAHYFGRKVVVWGVLWCFRGILLDTMGG